MDNDIERIIYDRDQIQKRISEMAKEIEKDYRNNKNMVVVSVLTGAVLFTIDLIEQMDVYCCMDFVDVSSWQGGTESTGEIKLVHDLNHDIKGKDVLICEDIVDSGRTLKFLMDLLHGRGANSIRVCSMMDKPSGRMVEAKVDYVGFEVPNEFLVGYGLDYKGYYRNLPYVGVLKPAVYENEDD